MAIPAASLALALASVIASNLDGITVISVSNAGGEFFRKVITDIEIVTSASKILTFYLNENEANDDIVSVSLYGNGATVTLGTGTEIASQALVLTKNNTNSLTIDWTVSIALPVS